MNRLQAFKEKVLIGLFLFAIYAPPIQALFAPVSGWSVIEKRELAVMPEITLGGPALLKLSSRFETFYNDHFGFRNDLIRQHNRLMKDWFGKSGVPKVLVGQDNWLYYTGSKLLEDYQGLVPLTDDELGQWKRVLEDRRDRLEREGIYYLFLVAPNKQTIYPEHLPDYFRNHKKKQRFDQLLEYLKQHSTIRLLDLRRPLMEKKKEGLVYHCTDTHWNAQGAYIAYKEIMGRIGERFPGEMLMGETMFDIYSQNGAGGDLAVMLGLADSLEEERPVFNLRSPCSEILDLNLEQDDPDPADHLKPLVMGCSQSRLKALVFRDSFFDVLIPFFSEHFNRVAYFMASYEENNVEELMEKIEPDIIVEQWVERNLDEVPTM